MLAHINLNLDFCVLRPCDPIPPLPSTARRKPGQSGELKNPEHKSDYFQFEHFPASG